ncbi:phosphoglycerate mutase, partial [Streptomyces nanshensis]
AVRTAVSPSPRCAQTAEELGIAAAGPADERLSGCAMGRWRGLTLEEVGAAEPEGVARWLSDPGGAPHGGESVEQLCARAEDWLTELAEEQGRVLAVVEPDVVRAMVVCALGAPARGLWRVDVAPLTVTELSGRSGRWNLRAGTALTAG